MKATKVEDIVELLVCKACGAPITKAEPGTNFYKCPYCGSVSRITNQSAAPVVLPNSVYLSSSNFQPYADMTTRTDRREYTIYDVDEIIR